MNKCPILMKSTYKPIVDAQRESLKESFDITYIDLERAPFDGSFSTCNGKYQHIVGLVAGTEVWDRDRLSSKLFPNLQVISRTGSGIDNIDFKYTDEENIILETCPEVTATPVAEFTLRHIIESTFNAWSPECNKTFSEVSVGIIGFGHIGSMVYKMCNNLGFTTWAYDTNSCYCRNKPEDLDAVLRCDVITWHIPYRDRKCDNAGCINESTLSRIVKPDVTLLNFSRPGLFNPKDLAMFCYDRAKTRTSVYVDGQWNVDRDGPMGAYGNYKNRHPVMVKEYNHMATSAPSVRSSLVRVAMENILETWVFGAQKNGK